MIFTVYDTAVAVTCIGAALTHMCTFSCIKPKSELPRHLPGIICDSFYLIYSL